MKYSKEIVKEICQHIEMGNTQKDAATLCDISDETFHQWKRNKPEFAEALKKAFASCKALHIANVRRHAFGLEGTRVRWTASAWWLERRCPEEYGQKWQGELSGKDGKPLMPESPAGVDTSRFTKEQLDKLIAATSVIVPPKESTHEPTHGNGDS